MCLHVCFFKQKTAYEMRISDWSSDVCSSDLRQSWPSSPSPAALAAAGIEQRLQLAGQRVGPGGDVAGAEADHEVAGLRQFHDHAGKLFRPRQRQHVAVSRSEEHTSELQSLMRISYAVFCLKKKTKKRTEKHHKKPQPLHIYIKPYT